MLFVQHGVTRRDRRTASCAVALAAATGVLLAASVAGAVPSVPEKRRQAELILAQVQTLDEQVGAAAERFNGASYELDRLTGRLRSTRADLSRARRQLVSARARASERLVQLYVNGSGPTTFEIVLGAADLGEMLDLLETNERIVKQDVRIVGDVERLAARTKTRERQLAVSRATQGRLVGRLGSERNAIAAKLRERQELLGSIRAEVEALEARERARQIELRRRADAELARQRALAAAQERRVAERTAPEDAVPAPAVTAPLPVEETAASAPIPSPAPAPPADASRGAQVVAIAMRYLGVPYKWGGASPSTGFDCSGFTMYVFAQIGVSLPHYAAAQYGLGRAVSKSELQAGDLVFFRGLGHMGMYIGGGNFIHSPRTGDVVKISSLSEPYRVANWVGARRIL